MKHKAQEVLNRINEDDLFYVNAPCRSCPTNPFHCEGGEVKGACTKMDQWLQLKNYVEMLENENKRLKRKIGHIQVMTNHHVCMIEEAQKKLKQIKELKQQLATKDKALDKACSKLEYEYTHNDRGRCPNVDYGFIPKCCNKDFCNDSNKECWKEWAENETTD